MTPIQQKLRDANAALSDIEKRVAEMVTGDADADAIKSLANEKIKAIEVRDAVSILADSEDRQAKELEAANEPVKPETREKAELRSKVSIGELLSATMKGQRTPSVISEYADAAGLRPEDVAAGHFPLDLLSPEPEMRADANTASPTTGKGNTVRPIIAGIFNDSLSAMLLGCEFPSVGTGGYSTMTITANLTAGARAEASDQESTAATITAVTREPKIISSRLTYNIRQSAIIGTTSFEPSLRTNLRMAHMQEVDAQVLTGNNTAPNLNGILSQQTDPTDPSAANVSWDNFWSIVVDALDDPFAKSPMDVALLTNETLYKIAGKTFRDRIIDTGNRGGVSLGDISVTDYMMAKSGGLHFSAFMPATASTIDQVLVIRSGCRAKGLPMCIVPNWNSAYLTVEDSYSGSASGDVAVTMHSLVGDPIIPHSTAYSRVDVKSS